MTISAEQVVQRVGAVPDPDPDDDIGELEIAEYVVFLLALETYARYIEEATGSKAEDDLLRRGVQLVRMADRKHLGIIQSFLGDAMPTGSQKKMMNKAFRFLPSNSVNLGRRTLQMQLAMNRGGASTMRKIFRSNKALREMRAAMSAADEADADLALDKFAIIPLKNIRLRQWIRKAAELAGSGSFQNAVEVGASESTADDQEKIYATRMRQEAANPASEDEKDAREEQGQALLDVEMKATEAAQQAMKVSGEADEPPSRSEVVGIAAATVTSALSDPDRHKNRPDSLAILGDDKEQLDAALTDGRVLVAAGAGSGKSTTLVGRVNYLVRDRKTSPSRILACSFNTEAAEGLRGKIAKQLDVKESSLGVQVGTMHALFRKYVVGDKQVPGLGTDEEQAMLKGKRLIARPRKGEQSINPISVSAAIRNMWKDCEPEVLAAHFGYPADWMVEPPKAKKAGLYMNKWRGNNVTLDKAKAIAKSQAESKAVVWYEFYLGLKGDIPGWRPPCDSKAYTKFMRSHRKGGERLGDLDDQLQVFLRILERDPVAKKKIQAGLDHFCVDEGQDLNLVQHRIFELLTEHITDGSDGKSYWVIGDDKQSIYQFRGAQPKLFQQLHGKEGWKTRTITTNYRSAPEIVETGNRLAEHNKDKIPMEAKARPGREEGKSSIIVDTPDNNVEAAIGTINRMIKDIATEDAKPEDYAVLSRTNAELNDFETACIINEIPYVRRGGKGFLDAPESKAVLGYLELVSGNDYERMRDALVAVLMKPDRHLFLGKPENVRKQIDEAIDDLARQQRIDVKMINPMVLLEGDNIYLLAEKLRMPRRLDIIRRAKNPRAGEYSFQKKIEELETNLDGLAADLRDLTHHLQTSGEQKTSDLIDYILDNMKSEVRVWDPDTGADMVTSSLREQITQDIALFADDEEEEEAEEEEEDVGEEMEDKALTKAEEIPGKGLGAVQFLYQLAVPNENDQQNNTDPSTADGFVAKVARYSKLADELRIDPFEWKKEQLKITDPALRKKIPPAITLSTIHKVKGAEWPNVSVLMPLGTFPYVPKLREGEEPPTPEEEEERMVAERNLAYVAITRAEDNLRVVCPMQTEKGGGGISPFVHEAGLVVGENVPKGEVFESGAQVGGPSEAVEETEAAEIAKTAYVTDLPDLPEDYLEN
jgi:superfamily I DNA/RNA helicase